LLFFATNKCEGKCKHCFYWKETNTEILELSTNEIEKFARNLGPMIQVTITGGSPELRTDLYDIISSFVKYCSPINITLCSNGNYPEILHKTVRDLFSFFPDLHLTVDLSLDGLNEEHDSIRGINGLFKNVTRSYSLLGELKNEYPNLRLGCGLVVSGLNKNNAVGTAKWAIKNLPIDNFTPVLVRGEPREREALDVHPDVFRDIADQVEKLLKSGDLRGYSNFTRIVNSKDIIQKKLIYKIYREQKFFIRCSALRETALVYPDGTVGCCELRNETPGNLRDYDMNIRNLWKSNKTKAIRKSVRKEKCYCWHQCFLSSSILKSPKMWIDLAANYIELK